MSFIIAAFALGEGLFTAQMYAAIVWAVLLSCITSPFMLLNSIKFFNKKQLNYLASTNPAKLAKEGGGTTPLFLHIKVKAPASGGMQEQFRKIVNELGLEVVERRTNRNGRGLNATVQTDLFVRDTTMMVKLQKIAAQKKIKHALAHAIEELHRSMSYCMSSNLSSNNLNTSFIKQNSCSVRGSLRRPSANNLSHLSLASLEKEAQQALQQAAQEEEAIINRGDLVEKKIEEALGEEADVVVDVWNPVSSAKARFYFSLPLLFFHSLYPLELSTSGLGLMSLTKSVNTMKLVVICGEKMSKSLLPYLTRLMPMAVEPSIKRRCMKHLQLQVLTLQRREF
jgi:hypothetical protein